MYKEIERSIIKKYRREIWRKFTKAINEFNLIENDDVIGVCISGGKDSFLLAKCIEELKRHGKINFEVKFILMDPGYKPNVLNQIKENAKKLNLDIYIFKTNIFKVTDKNEKPCYLCARMRRGSLYNEAKNLGCNKIALGHHFDDVIETVLLSMIYNGEFKTMLPILNSTNYKGMKLIRPLYYVREKDIISWAKFNNLTFSPCACNFSNSNKESKRIIIKNLIKQLNNIYPNADINIMNSTKDVNLDTLISYIE